MVPGVSEACWKICSASTSAGSTRRFDAQLLKSWTGCPVLGFLRKAPSHIDASHVSTSTAALCEHQSRRFAGM